MATLVGRTVGGFRIVARLGRGGMAEVFKAYQPGMERYVAIKVMYSHMVGDEDFVGRFRREAKATGQLRHPNIVQALTFDSEGETYFMAMEFIDGPTLKSEMGARRDADKPFTLKEIARIFTALSNALDYAHKRGMVHRDLKPANVMINEQGEVVLTDFGIARIVGATQYTATGALSGTPAYMSPEQGRGERGDERSDIYALGVMLYELVTGIVPYDADTPFAVIMKHINEPLLVPTKVDANIPKSVEQVILKAMEKKPDNRYQTAGELAQALREAVGLMPGEENIPLTVVAPRPEIDELDPTGAFTAIGAGATVARPDDAATVYSAQGEATTLSTPTSTFPMLPIVVGGGVIALLIVAGIVGFFLISGNNPTPTPTEDPALAIAAAARTATAEIQSDRATASAEANAAATAEAKANATITAEAADELAAPTQTAQAGIDIANTATAEFEREQNLIGGVLATVEAATAEAVTAEAIIAETATAEFLANITPTTAPTDTPIPTDTPTLGPPTNTPPPTDTPTPERPAILGKLAFPVDDGAGKYDVHIVSIPDGAPIGLIKGARQPYFRGDGAKLLVNGEGGSFGENVFEASPNGTIDRAVSDSPTDSHPVYNDAGVRITYGNPQLAIGTDGNYHSYIFVQCGIIPPAQEGDQTCQDIARFGILVPAGQIGEVQGSNPVWTVDDRVAYKGCDSWKGGGSCGIFISVSWGNKRGGEGHTPTKLIDGSSTIPTDTKGGLIAFHSRESGNWEAYVMGLDGAGVVNISNSPNSRDGLPTISPDGQWVAFASDRDGGWAVYVAPVTGGEASKLFDFPKPNPWATGDRDWTNERISWGP